MPRIKSAKRYKIWGTRGFCCKFEDWLNSKLDPDDPYFKLQRMIKARETAIYSQFVDEAIKILKKSVLDRGEV